MLTQVQIKNFMCLRDVTIQLSPMTVLVGPNAAGKSAILQSLQPNNPSWAQRWQQRDDVTVEVTHSYDDGRDPSNLKSKISTTDGAIQSFRNPNWKPHSFQLLRLSPNSLREQNQVSRDAALSVKGANLANVFYSLGRSRQIAISESFVRLVPAIRDVDIRPTHPAGYHTLVFEDRWQRDLWYTPDQVSDGTILMLAFLILQYQDPPVDLLCIEEPERGLHPYLLGEVIELLRKLANGELGKRPIQVVLATHSPELLDRAKPEEVRFLSRNEESGSVLVQEAPIETSEWKQAYLEYQESLGSAWLSGGLGGVPGGR